MKTANHDLKTSPVYFQRVWEGEKTFEVRLDDRGYQKGDTVTLREWDRNDPCACPHGESRGQHTADCARYSGRTITARIGFVTASTPASKGGQRGFVGMGYVVFSLLDQGKHDGRSRTTVEGRDHDQPPTSPGAAAQVIAAAAARKQSRI